SISGFLCAVIAGLASCGFSSECHGRGVGIDFFAPAKPTESTAPQIPSAVAIGDLVKMSLRITEHTNYGLRQPQGRKQPAGNVLLPLIWQLTQQMVPVSHCCP